MHYVKSSSFYEQIVSTINISDIEVYTICYLSANTKKVTLESILPMQKQRGIQSNKNTTFN